MSSELEKVASTTSSSGALSTSIATPVLLDGAPTTTTTGSYDTGRKDADEEATIAGLPSGSPAVDGAAGEKPAAVQREGETDEAFAVRAAHEAREGKYLTGLKLVLVFAAMLLSVLLIALDQTIVATALPVIASQFDALDQVTWIISAYFLTQAPLILVYGQLLTILSTKWTFVTAVTLFEIGSLICGVAQSAEVLIFGRAFAGVGAGGIFVCILSIVAEVSRIEDRPKLFGAFGGVFGIASVVGPLLGGVFTERLSWRWAFYVNLPAGGVTLVAIVWFVKAAPAAGLDLIVAKEVAETGAPKSTLRRVASLDWLGAVLMLGLTTCLILALQQGGISKPWSDASIIAEFVVFGVVLVVFIGWEYYRRNSSSLLPLAFFKDRTVVGAAVASFMLMFVMLSGIYYLPIYYQAVKSHSPTQSGIDILAFMLAMVISSIVAGGLISKTGHYFSFLIFGPLILTPIGGGLLWTVTPTTSTGFLIGAQILIAAGIGMAFQNLLISVQANFHATPSSIPQATATVTFFQLIGGVIGISIAGTVFNNQIISQLAVRGVSSEVVSAVIISVENIHSLTGDLRTAVLAGYVRALAACFVMAVPAATLAAAAAAFIKPINLLAIGGMESMMAAA